MKAACGGAAAELSTPNVATMPVDFYTIVRRTGRAHCRTARTTGDA